MSFGQDLRLTGPYPLDELHHLPLQELCLQRAGSFGVQCAGWVPNGSRCTCMKRVIAAAVGWLSIAQATITRSLPAACVTS